MQIVSFGDNLQEMAKSIFCKNKKKYYKMSAEIFYPACSAIKKGTYKRPRSACTHVQPGQGPYLSSQPHT